MPFDFKKQIIPEIILIKLDVFTDERGYFMEIYKHSDFAKAGIVEYFVQDNRSKSSQFVLRGLHYQKNPKAQGKLVYCSKGKIFDVAVDIRKGSPTYAQWVAIELSEDNDSVLYIPPGFAHGFLALSKEAEVVYKCTEEYSPDNDRGILWNDPDIGINWPVNDPIISQKDKRLPVLRSAQAT